MVSPQYVLYPILLNTAPAIWMQSSLSTHPGEEGPPKGGWAKAGNQPERCTFLTSDLESDSFGVGDES